MSELRALSSTEAFYARAATLPYPHFMMGRLISFKSKESISNFSLSLENELLPLIQKIYPILQCTIIEDKNNGQLKWAKSLKSDEKTFEFRSNSSEKPLEYAVELMENELPKRIDFNVSFLEIIILLFIFSLCFCVLLFLFKQSKQWKVFYVHSSDFKTHCISLILNHALVDGRGAKALMESIISLLCGEKINEIPTPFPISDYEVVKVKNERKKRKERIVKKRKKFTK